MPPTATVTSPVPGGPTVSDSAVPASHCSVPLTMTLPALAAVSMTTVWPLLMVTTSEEVGTPLGVQMVGLLQLPLALEDLAVAGRWAGRGGAAAGAGGC